MWLYFGCPLIALFFTVSVIVFVILCVYVMACICCLFIEFIGLFCVCSSVSLLPFCFWCVCFVCGVLSCRLLFHWFVVRVCAVAVALFSFLCLVMV